MMSTTSRGRRSHGTRYSSVVRYMAAIAVCGVLVAFAGVTNAQQGGKAKGAKSGTPASKATRLDKNRRTSVKKLIPQAQLKQVDPDADQPIIKVDNMVHDFGETWIGPKLEHTYKITNSGKKPLEIIKVKPACGCTIAGQYPRKLEPGQSGDFPFSVRSDKLRGKYTKNITISTNDPVNPDIRLTLKGECKRYVDVLPAAANFSRIFGTGEKHERILKVTNNTKQPLELELDVPADSKFKFELIEVSKGARYEIRVSTSGDSEAGRITTKATLKTNIAEQKTISITATATVPKRLDVVPSSITLPNPATAARAATRPTTRVVRVTNYGKDPVKVLEATVSNPDVKVTTSERNNGKNYDIRVEIPAGFKTPAGGAQLVIKTDDKKFPTLSVPIVTLGSPRATAANRQQRKRPAEQLVGQPAPSFTLNTTTGKPVNNGTLKDAITVLDFFAVNCGFCKKQIPRLETVRKQYESKGVRFITVSQTMRGKKYTNEEVTDKIKSLGFKGELALDPENTVGPQFKATSFPTMMVLGKSGKVEAANIGNIGDLESRLRSQLDALLAGKPVPTIAAAKRPTPPPAPNQPRKRPVELLVGKPAPAFSATTKDGKSFSNASTKGTVTILDFFAANCGYCSKQLPRFETVRKQYDGKAVRFVAVSQTMRGKKYTNEEIMAKLNTANFKGEVVFDPDNKIGTPFKAQGFPTMVVLGKDGKVAAANVGNVGDLESRMKGQIDALLAGKPVPTIAATPPPAPKQPRKRPVEMLVGNPAPAFSATTKDGKPFSNSSTKGTVTILDFFAANCGYCSKQLPRYESVRKQYDGKPVRFVAVSQTMRGKKYTNEEIMAKLNTAGFKGEVVFDPDNKIGTPFKAQGFPTMVVLGKDGKVAAANVGNVGDLESRMKGQIDALLLGKPVPTIAGATPPAPAKNQPRKRPVEMLVGKPAPAFSATTKDGKPMSNESTKGSVTVFDFFAANCGYCSKQLPRFEVVRKEFEGKDVRFVAVSQTMRGKKYTDEEIMAKLNTAGFKGEVVFDPDNKIGTPFKAQGFPTMVIVGKDGKVGAANIGNIGDLEKRMRGQIGALLQGKPVPSYASTAPQQPKKRPAMELQGKTAPTIALTTKEGKPVNNADFAKNAATVLNFVAPGCGYCKKQLPNIEKIRKEYVAKGVRFINVSETMRPPQKTAEQAAAVFNGVGNYAEVAVDAGNTFGRGYKVVSYPTMMIVDKNGTITNVTIGAKADIDTMMKAHLDGLIAKN